MSILGKLFAEVVDTACDVVTLSVGVTADVIKAPVRLFNILEPDITMPDESFTENTQEAIEMIKEK